MRYVIPFLIVMVLGSASAANDWKVVFEDEFEREAIGMDWLIMRGDWRIEDGRLKITRDWASDSCIRTTKPLRENVRFEFEMRPYANTYTRAAVRIGDQYWDGGGQARAGRGAKGGGQGDVIFSPPGLKKVADSADFKALEAMRWYKVRVEYEDGRLRAWIDDRLIRDEEIILTGRYNDYCALFCILDAEYDNVRISTKPYREGFHPEPVATPETNRIATQRVKPDPSRIACGIQAAVDALPPTGGAVILPEGTFVLHQSIFLREGVTMRGQGRKTVLALPSPIVWTKLTVDAKPGDTTLRVEDASAFKPEWQLSLGVDPMYYLRSTGPWRVAKAEGKTLALNKPLAKSLRKGAPIGNWFPVIYASNDADIEVRDFHIEGRVDDPAPFEGGYGASAVTFFFVRNVRCCDISVNGWKGDGFSFQGGRDNLCSGCTIVRATGNGYHPGSCQRRMILTRNLAEGCGGDGFYFCRYNQQSIVCTNDSDSCKGAMIGGLASAGDAWNVIAFNRGRRNGRGIPIQGGANDILFRNAITDCGGDAAISLTGGQYANWPRGYYWYTGPCRYFVICGNSIHTLLHRPPPRVIRLDDGAAANVIMGNVWLGAAKAELVLDRGTDNIVADNLRRDSGLWLYPSISSPQLPDPVLHATPSDPFQKAIDELSAKGGGTVRLPAGHYPIHKTLRVPSNVTLCGEGIATVLEWHGVDAAIRAEGQNVGVRRLRIVHTNTETAPRRNALLVAASDALIEGVDIAAGSATAVAMRGCKYSRISECRMQDSAVGLQIEKSDNLRVRYCHFLSNVVGTDVKGMDTMREPTEIGYSVFHGNRSVGVSVAADQDGWLDLIACVLSTCGDHAVRLGGGWNYISGTVIRNGSQGKAALLIDKGNKRAEIVASRIADDRYRPLQTAAIRTVEGSADTILRGNVLCPCIPVDDAHATKPLEIGSTIQEDEHNVLSPYPPTRPQGAK